NPSEMDTREDLARKLHQAEKRNVELMNERNREMSRYEKEIMKLRLELEGEEVLRQGLQSEISFARKEACIQMYSAENELCDVK
ncbi:CC171 protein, partial [Machaerirhynchus nigripectus]|nr:CC171 protein [Machaerirhynchus nigripectus]